MDLTLLLLVIPAIVAIFPVVKLVNRSEFHRLIVAADKGNAVARTQLDAYLRQKGFSDESYIKYRLKMYTKMAQRGDAFAECQIGQDLLYRQHDFKRAYPYLLNAAEKGNVEAMMVLGLSFSAAVNETASPEEGLCVNNEESFRWFLKAASFGNAHAMRHVADAYEDGIGTAADSENARRWLENGAKINDPECMLRLADYYGVGKPNCNKEKRIALLERVMRLRDEACYAKAAFLLGLDFGAPFFFEGAQKDRYTNARKAAYCMILKWVVSGCTDNSLWEYVQKTGYQPYQDEFAHWKADAAELRYCP